MFSEKNKEKKKDKEKGMKKKRLEIAIRKARKKKGEVRPKW